MRFEAVNGASRLPVARLWLALGAAVRRAVHERVAADRGAAAGARLAFAAVDVQRAVEVAAFTVDVDVKRGKRGAARLECLCEYLADRFEQAGSLAPLQGLGGAGPVQPGPPERLVGVDVADP